MKILFFDLKTTGLLEDQNSSVTELAYALYCVETRRTLTAGSHLVNSLAPGEVLTPEIEALTGIKTDTLFKNGISPHLMVKTFNDIAAHADAVAAHNGLEFDYPMLKREASRLEMSVVEKPMIDTKVDIDYPKTVRSLHLTYLAADHGFLNPFPHQGLSDVMTMIRVMEVGGYDLKKAYERALSPVVRVLALVTFDQRDIAKQAGFSWDPDRKQWYKKMRKSVYEESKFDFRSEARKDTQS